MKRIVLVCLGLLCASAYGADRAATIKALLEAQGLLETFEQQRIAGEAAGRKFADEIIAQALKELSAPEKVEPQIREAMEAFASEGPPPKTSEQLVDLWANLYGKKFSDQELADLLKFYSSRLGQKEVAASRAAIGEFTAIAESEMDGVMGAAMQRLMDRLKKIIRDCNCKK